MSITPLPVEAYNGCPWPVDPACFSDEWENLTDDERTRGLALASETLHRLSGYRVGGCPVTVRPSRRRCFHGGNFYPRLHRGQWYNNPSPTCDCPPSPDCSLRLPLPVGRLDRVDDGGADITADCSMVGDRLIWSGAGDCPFPFEQDLTIPPGSPGAFSVTYLNSYPPDGSAQAVVAVLAMEFAKACAGRSCKLPTGVTSIVRQGVSMEIVIGAFPDGWTSIRSVDAWIALWRSEGSARQPTRIWSPGVPQPVVDPR